VSRAVFDCLHGFPLGGLPDMRIPPKHRCAHVSHDIKHGRLRHSGFQHLGAHGVPEIMEAADRGYAGRAFHGNQSVRVSSPSRKHLRKSEVLCEEEMSEDDGSPDHPECTSSTAAIVRCGASANIRRSGKDKVVGHQGVGNSADSAQIGKEKRKLQDGLSAAASPFHTRHCVVAPNKNVRGDPTSQY